MAQFASLPEQLERGPLGTRDPAGQQDVESEVAGVAKASASVPSGPPVAVSVRS